VPPCMPVVADYGVCMIPAIHSNQFPNNYRFSSFG
jgi:hypothetical protein